MIHTTCDRCGNLAEMPAMMMPCLFGVPVGTVVFVCVECCELRWTNAELFHRQGWEGAKGK